MYEIERKIDEVRGDLNRFEIVILLARRARQITEKRVALEQQMERKAITKEKDTIKAIKGLIDGSITYERTEEVYKASSSLEETPPKAGKTVL
ncbi:DNA-directed RNA polymerase subunit omega [bacterium]|nr:DNA-directed RNA polymerase subunit omega [bacterium]